MGFKARSFLLTVVALLVSVGCVLVCFGSKLYLLEGEAGLRRRLLESTPTGTSLSDVVKSLGVRQVSYTLVETAGYLRQDQFGARVVGTKHIRANLGQYRIIFSTNVTAFFGFDSDGKLIDIWVWKTVDAL